MSVSVRKIGIALVIAFTAFAASGCGLILDPAAVTAPAANSSISSM